VPIVRGRIKALNGETVRPDAFEDEEKRRIVTFEFAFTYRGELEEGEQIIAGTWDDPDVQGPQVSVADWWAEDMDMGVGDTVTLSVQGVPVQATITSVREIDWSNRRTNFSFVFLPGVLEQAPRMYVTALRVSSEEQRVALQQDVSDALPNVSSLDVAAIFQRVQQIMDRIALVIQFMAAFCVAVGLVILIGTIATTKYQRLREAVLLKTLGATRGKVARVLATEYGMLGLLAGLVGSAAAGALSWALVTQVFEGRWFLNVPAYAVAWGVAAVLIVGAGLAASVDILTRKPLQVLREE